MKFLKRDYCYNGECYIESKRYVYEIQRPISQSKTKCFIARRFSKLKKDSFYHRFLDIDSKGNLVRGCTLQLTTLKTAKSRVIKAFKKRFKPIINL